jgi:hypothetical protein
MTNLRQSFGCCLLRMLPQPKSAEQCGENACAARTLARRHETSTSQNVYFTNRRSTILLV